MSISTVESSVGPSGLKISQSNGNNNRLSTVLQGLNATLVKLAQASDNQTVAIAELKEHILLHSLEPEVEENAVRQPEGINISAIINYCTIDMSTNNMVSMNATWELSSNPESRNQTNLVDSLTQAIYESTKKSPAIEGKITELIEHVLTGGISADTVKESAVKYPVLENINLQAITSVNEEVWDLLSRRSQAVDLAFQTVRELLV